MSARELARGFTQIVKKSAISQNSSQLAFSMASALIPLAVFIMFIMARFGVPARELFNSLALILPSGAYNSVQGALEEISTSPSLSVFSLASALSLAAGGVRGVMAASDYAWGNRESRGFVRLWIQSFLLAALIAVMFTAALVMGVFGNLVAEAALERLRMHASWIIGAARTLVMLITCLLSSWAVYFLCDVTGKPMRAHLPGACAFSAGWLALCRVFGAYVDSFSGYNILFGSLGGVFMLLAWLYYSSWLLVFGVHLNALLEPTGR